MTQSTSPTILHRLRSETRSHHERAEKRVGLPISRAAYVETLARFYGFIGPWEDIANRTLAFLADELAGRRKSHLLESDLAYFGVTANSVPRCEHLPRVDTVATALGSMYVFEGATLGGQIVARHIEQNLGLSNGDGYAFHRSYGARVGEMWRRFGAALVSQSTPAIDDEIVASAAETFDRLCDWFDQPIAVATQWSNSDSHSIR